MELGAAILGTLFIAFVIYLGLKESDRQWEQRYCEHSGDYYVKEFWIPFRKVFEMRCCGCDANMVYKEAS